MTQHRWLLGPKERRGQPLPPGRTYPPVPSDEQLFDSPEEMRWLMGSDLAEEEVRMLRASGLI